MFKRLKEFFSIEINGENIVGPAYVEVTEQQFKLNIHKFEPELDELQAELEKIPEKDRSDDVVAKITADAQVIKELEQDQAELDKVSKQVEQIKENIKQKKSKK